MRSELRLEETIPHRWYVTCVVGRVLLNIRRSRGSCYGDDQVMQVLTNT